MIISVDKIPEDLSWVKLREADEAECLAAGMTAAQAIAYSAKGSAESFMVSVDGVVAAFWGYSAAPISPRATAWLLTTEAVEDCKVKLARSSRRVVKYLLGKYSEVIVVVALEHKLSCKWLTWLGFETMAQNKDFQMMIVRREKWAF